MDFRWIARLERLEPTDKANPWILSKFEEEDRSWRSPRWPPRLLFPLHDSAREAQGLQRREVVAPQRRRYNHISCFVPFVLRLLPPLVLRSLAQPRPPRNDHEDNVVDDAVANYFQDLSHARARPCSSAGSIVIVNQLRQRSSTSINPRVAVASACWG